MLTWKAYYNDDSSLTQYNEDGKENKYKDIERHKLTHFDLINEAGKKIHRTALHDGQRLIYRRRNFISLGNTEERHLIYLVGWQMTIITPAGEKNITAINYIYEDGSVALDGHRDDLELLREELE